MAVNFPGTLQQKFNEQGFSVKIGETTIRSQVDVGPAKIRRRYTKGIDTNRGTIDLYWDEWETLKDFYNTTLDGGSQPFNFEDPFTQAPIEYRFVTSPSATPIGGGWFKVSFELEVLP